MKKVSLEEKTKVLDHYIDRPNSIDHPTVLRAIKTDVLKANNAHVKSASDVDNALYNKCMGLYRQFLKAQGLPLKLDGKKARIYREAMNNLIGFMRSLAKENGTPYDDIHIERLFKKLFKSWDLLNDFHRGQIGLPDIYRNIEEIIPQIKNGKSTSKTNISDSYKQRVLDDLQS